MNITKKQFIEYLIKNQDKEIYFTSDRKNAAQFQFTLLKAPNPLSGLNYNIKFYSKRWKTECTASNPETTLRFLKIFNDGGRDKKDYKRSTGTPSRRGGYLLQVFKKIEENISKSP